MTSHFEPFSLDDLIAHDAVLEQYNFLSAQILNRWFRTGLIRLFKGKEGKTVYLKTDLVKAIDRDMTWQNDQALEASLSTETSGSPAKPAVKASIDTGTTTELDELREKLFLRSLSKKPVTSSLNSSAHQSRRAGTRVKSSSSMS